MPCLSEAEPLYRRALAIDEASYGPEHPKVAIDLNNLALLLLAASRPGEAEALMSRAVAIFFKFTRDTGRSHPHLQAAFGNYQGLLRYMDYEQEELERRIGAVGAEAGLDEEEFRALLDDL